MIKNGFAYCIILAITLHISLFVGFLPFNRTAPLLPAAEHTPLPLLLPLIIKTGNGQLNELPPTESMNEINDLSEISNKQTKAIINEQNTSIEASEATAEETTLTSEEHKRIAALFQLEEDAPHSKAEQAADMTEVTPPLLVRVQPRLRPENYLVGYELGNNITGKSERKITYEKLVGLWLDRHKHYPTIARLKKIEGIANIRLTIDRNGQIKQYQLLQSTGNKSLDKAVDRMIQKSNPVPKPPSGYSQAAEMVLELTIYFKVPS